MPAVPAGQHYPREPYDPGQGWNDPVPTTLTCGCGLVFTGATLLQAVTAFSGHQYDVVPVGTVMDTTARPLPPGELCEGCELREATQVVMGPIGPVPLCPDPACARFPAGHLGRLPRDIWSRH